MLSQMNFYQNNFARFVKIASFDKFNAVISEVSQEKFQEMVMNSPAKAQFIGLAALYCQAVEKSQNPADFGPVDGILYSQAQKIAKFGDKTYPLSEAQINLVFNRVAPWIWVK